MERGHKKEVSCQLHVIHIYRDREWERYRCIYHICNIYNIYSRYNMYNIYIIYAIYTNLFSTVKVGKLEYNL